MVLQFEQEIGREEDKGRRNKQGRRDKGRGGMGKRRKEP